MASGHAVAYISLWQSDQSRDSGDLRNEINCDDQLDDSGQQDTSTGAPSPVLRSFFLIGRDRYNLVYLSLVLSGIGFLLPYNSFVNAVDLYQDRFCSSAMLFHFTATYLSVMVVSVALNNLLVTRISFRWRITIGFLLAFLPLAGFTIFDVCLELFAPSTSYSLTLLAAALVAFGCTSLSGVIICLFRLLSELVFPRRPAVFFVASTFLLGLCFVTFHLSLKTDFVQQYLQRANPNMSTSVTQQNSLLDSISISSEKRQISRYGKSNTAFLSDQSTANHEEPPELHEEDELGLDDDEDDDEDEEISRELPDVVESSEIRPSTPSFRQTLEVGLASRKQVIRTIWPHMMAIGLAYLVTMSLFPGIETEIPSLRWPKLIPIILMLIFNFSDFVGKLLAAFPIRWTGQCLMISSAFRVILIPLIVLCAAPAQHPTLAADSWSIVLSAILGVSNGYFGSVPMILAPQMLPTSQRELAGNMMTMCYSIGLTTGSFLAYALDGIVKLSSAPPAYSTTNTSLVMGLLANETAPLTTTSRLCEYF